MQVLRDNFFYHTNSRLGADEGLKDEKQLLVEDQKFYRARARKFSLETNRRRKVLEEKRRQWDAQEQQLRDNILQQRRQQVQDATERFQRAHLPLSQRKRQSFKRNIPTVEDALSEIQGTFTSYTQQPSSYINRPPMGLKPSHLQVFSAVEAYTKLLQEQSNCANTRSEPLERQQHLGAQDNRLSCSWNSEILSNKDSLEESGLRKNLHSASCVLDLERTLPDLRRQNDFYPQSDLSHFTNFMLQGDNIPLSRKPYEAKVKKHEECEGLGNKTHLSKTPWGPRTTELTPKADPQPDLHHCSLVTICEMIKAESQNCEVSFPQSSPTDNAASKAAPGNAALESPCPKQETVPDLRQQRAQDDRQSKHPSATETPQSTKNGSGKDVSFGPPPTSDALFCTVCKTSPDGASEQTGKENLILPPKKLLSASLNNLNKVSNSDYKPEKSINTELLHEACVPQGPTETSKCLKCPEKEPLLPLNRVGVIKSILKKPSRHIPGDNPSVFPPGNGIFSKPVALAIRDSLDLNRTKAKEAEVKNGAKKKLRWYDEVQAQKDDTQQALMKQMRGRLSTLSQTRNQSEDHQLSRAGVPGVSRLGAPATPAASLGYHFTKQAWADVGVQGILPPEHADEVKVPWCATRTGGPKVPWREYSARARAGPVSSWTRKGIFIRPQSATEVNQIAKTQGKMMMPRPPPRMESKEEKNAQTIKAPYGADHAGVNCKQGAAGEQAPHKDSPEGFFSPYAHRVIRPDNGVVYTPLPPAYTCPVSEGTPSMGHQEGQACGKRRGLVYDENGLCLDCTPTEDEISQLWHGVCSALATKDAKSLHRRQALESGRVKKPCAEQGRQPPGSRNKRPPQCSQPPGLAADSGRTLTRAYDITFPSEGHFHRSEAPPEGVPQERDLASTTVDLAQTQRAGKMGARHQQQGVTNISLEEQRLLFSLDRLNHQLNCVRENVGGTPGPVFTDNFGPWNYGPPTREAKATNHQRLGASIANNHTRPQTKKLT